MKHFDFIVRRNYVEDTLTVRVVNNDLGMLPEWVVEGPGTYTARFPGKIGIVPNQVTPILGSDIHFIVCEGGDDFFTMNTMKMNGDYLEAELTDYLVRIVVLDNLLQTATVAG